MPLGDDDSALRMVPVVTFALIAANVLAFFVEIAQPDVESFIRTWSVVPLEYARRADLPPTHPGPFWITTWSAMFMHGGWAHLGGNMLFLWIFGDNVEAAMGRLRFACFYLLCGIAATLAHVALDSGSAVPSLGASGAISGVLGGYLALFPRQRIRVLVGRGVAELPAIAVIGLWAILQFVNGFGQLASTEETGGVAYAAHVGGFIAGLALVWVFRRGDSRRIAAVPGAIPPRRR